MKIGILTVHNQINYGGVLQAYALQKYLRDQNYDAELINYWCSRDNSYLDGGIIGKKISFKVLVRLAIKFLKNGFIYADLKRRKRTIEFLRQHCRIGEKVYRDAEELKSLAGYDCVIVGSDQIWNPKWHGVPNPFLLDFLPDDMKRISYAASFGVRDIDDDRQDEYANALKKFSSLSVREQEGVEIIKRLTGLDAEWVLDPTLLLAKDDWEELAAQGDNHAKGYVFCYWLGDLRKILRLLCLLAHERKVKIQLFADPHILESSYGKIKSIIARLVLVCMPQIRCRFDAGPLEFVQGICFADAVVSDSFHALMFACVYRKPVKIYLHSAEGRSKMSGRLKDFIRIFEIEGSIEAEVPTNCIDIYLPDYHHFETRMRAYGFESKRFLKRAL